MEVKRNFDILTHLEQNYPKPDTLAVKRDGTWIKFSSGDYRHNVDLFSCGLIEMGFKPGDKIATVSNNRPEWNFADMGMSQIGVVHVPIYPTIGPVEYEHILRHSNARILIVHSKERYGVIKPVADKVETLEQIYSFDKLDGVKNFYDIIELGKANQEKHMATLQQFRDAVKPDDMCTMIYTSGTTGLPKGVMLSHRNFISNVHACEPHLPMDHTKRALSFLPLCHVLERMVNYLYQHMGVSIYYAESMETIGDNMREVSPNCIVVVPRVLEKIFDRILEKGNELDGFKRKLFYDAVDLSEKFELEGRSFFYDVKRKLFDKLIYSKWRAATGGKLEVILSGGAALQPRLARVFHCAGIQVQEGYGLTETSPVISVNRVHLPFIRFGSVGKILDNVEVKIAEDGEILFKGPNLMLGYYKDPEKTAEVIDHEGWFHTGDIGELDQLGMLKITDRKKEIFKLSTGKYVAPQAVENKMKESSFIEQLMVVGADEKYAAAIICPNFPFLHDWASEHKIHFKDNIELIENPKVIERIQKEVDRLNEHLGRHEQIKKFELVCEQWTPDSGELSPTLKLKRRFVVKKYEVKLKRLFGHSAERGHVGERVPYKKA